MIWINQIPKIKNQKTKNQKLKSKIYKIHTEDLAASSYHHGKNNVTLIIVVFNYIRKKVLFHNNLF